MTGLHPQQRHESQHHSLECNSLFKNEHRTSVFFKKVEPCATMVVVLIPDQTVVNAIHSFGASVGQAVLQVLF
jgi:hypothetical protein